MSETHVISRSLLLIGLFSLLLAFSGFSQADEGLQNDSAFESVVLNVENMT
jgi:hypothetical protein